MAVEQLLWFKALKHSVSDGVICSWVGGKVGGFIVVSPFTLMAMNGQLEELLCVGHMHPNQGLFRTELPRTLASFPSIGYLLVSSTLQALRVLLLVLTFSPSVFLGSEYLFWLLGLNVIVIFLPALPKLYFLWHLTPSTQLYFFFFLGKLLHSLFSLLFLLGYPDWTYMI